VQWLAWEVETPRAVAARARAKLLFAEAFTVLLETAALFAAAGLQLVLFQALHKLLIHKEKLVCAQFCIAVFVNLPALLLFTAAPWRRELGGGTGIFA